MEVSIILTGDIVYIEMGKRCFPMFYHALKGALYSTLVFGLGEQDGL
jgi:hypothetical protein